MIVLYGSGPTRSTRAAWMLEELGLKYELLHDFDQRSPEFSELLRHNPNGKLPTLVDDGFAVWESMAVNLYLAQKYGGGLWPESFEDQTRASMWSFWAMTELEQPLYSMIALRRRDPGAAAELDAKVQRPLRVLEAELSSHTHLLGDAFTVADLNVACVVTFGRFGQLDFSPFPRVDAWHRRCIERPAAKRMAKLPMMPPPRPAQ
jgi:glutathione S-transferase